MKVQEIQNFTPTDFQAKNFTPQIQSFSDNNKKKDVFFLEKFTQLAKVLHSRWE